MSERGSAFFFSKGESERDCVRFSTGRRKRERVRHFEERANALIISKFDLFPNNAYITEDL